MTKTQHYQLNQWDAGDRVLREDFNADNAKIDEALKQASTHEISIGTYTGTNKVGAPTTVNVGFHPAMVLIVPNGRSIGSSTSLLFTKEKTITNGSYTLAQITATGFEVYTHVPVGWDSPVGPHINSNIEYCYVAFR